MRPVTFALIALVVAVCDLSLDFFAAPSALADTHGDVPAGGGLSALDVNVDLGHAVVHAGAVDVPIPVELTQLPTDHDVAMENVAIGLGKHVIHVRVPLRDAGDNGPAWEAVLAADRKEPIFAGMTGPITGDPGERTGKAIEVVPNGATSFVLVGDVREDVGICGQATTLLDPLALYPASLELRPATVQRLSVDRQGDAEQLTAKDKGSAADVPLAQLLVARGSSVPGSRGAELVDGDTRTSWQERRPGFGQGEFVVMAAPKSVPITRIQVILSAPSVPPAPNGASPKTLYLVTSTGATEVTLPNDGWTKAGQTYEVVFPKPLETACLALVLDSAYSRGLGHPDVGVAELEAFSEFDASGATLDDVAKRLSSDRGIAAAQVLERAGDRALAAVSNVYDTLDARGRALAMDVAASHASCEEAASLLARGLCEPLGQAPRKAREKLERCRGAAPSLVARMHDDADSRTCIAPVLANLAPEQALEPIADALDSAKEEDHGARATLRAALAAALVSAPPGRLATLLGDPRRSALGRLEVIRAAEGHVVDAAPQTAATIAELLSGTPSMRVRYLVLGPLAELAHSGDRSASGRLAESIVRDPDWPVRARAAELSVRLPDAVAALVQAAGDPEPRVREAALSALSPSPPPAAARAGIDALGRDGWSFVKVQALAMLVNVPPSKDVDDALAEVLGDPSARVRTGAVLALARRRATSSRSAIRDRLDDAAEDAQVRAAAASALGALCDTDSTDRLTELARTLASPMTDEDGQQVALGALLGLSALKPNDLRGRIGPLLEPNAPGYARGAAQRALAARPLCERK